MSKHIRYFLTLTVVIICMVIITVGVYAEGNNRGVVSGNNVNLREQPNLSAKIITKLNKGIKATIIEKKSDWYLIRTVDGNDGWIYSDYIETRSGDSFAKITGDNVNMRRTPELSGQVITQLSNNTNLKVKDLQGDWYYVVTPENQGGWVYKDYLMFTSKKNTNNTNSTSRSFDRKSSSSLISFAKKQLNTPYSYGSSGPDAFDCSGFSSYVYKNFGIDIPRSSSEQATVGTYVPKDELAMGDLVFFNTSSSNSKNISHVGIYIENGKFIHASSGKNSRKVVISNINEKYYKERYVTARRIL